MQNVRSYFSSWKPFWKTSTKSCHTQSLTLAPSSINFTDSSLGDLKHSVIDEQLMIDISRKLISSISPPKLQICAHNNQWFALNNSHLLIYRQLERVGLCDSVVCDIIPSQDVPIGIRETLTPVDTSSQEDNDFLKNSKEKPGNHFIYTHDDGDDDGSEVVYCSNIQPDTCGCLDDEDECNSCTTTSDDSDENDEFDDEQIETSKNITKISTISNNRLDDIGWMNDEFHDSHKEMQSLL